MLETTAWHFPSFEQRRTAGAEAAGGDYDSFKAGAAAWLHRALQQTRGSGGADDGGVNWENVYLRTLVGRDWLRSTPRALLDDTVQLRKLHLAARLAADCPLQPPTAARPTLGATQALHAHGGAGLPAAVPKAVWKLVGRGCTPSELATSRVATATTGAAVCPRHPRGTVMQLQWQAACDAAAAAQHLSLIHI